MINSNIIHQVLYSERNIIYKPHNVLFDNLLFGLDYNFYVFNDNYSGNKTNALGLPESHIDLYAYDFVIGNNLVEMSQDPLPKQLHLNTLVFEHNQKPLQIKKEDLAIIGQKTRNIKKIFFNEHNLKSWGQQTNSILLDYGIPLNLFSKTVDTSNREKDVLIINIPNNISGQHLKGFAENAGMKCDLIEDIDSISFDTLCNYFNTYKAIINLRSDRLLTLISIACGCVAIVLSTTNQQTPSSIHRPSINDIAQNLITDVNIPVSYDEVTEYLINNHNFEIFKIKLSDIIEHDSTRKAFVL